MKLCSTAALLWTLASPPGHDGARPSGAWTASGGAADGAGVSAAEPLERQPEVLWSFGPLEFEAEPLAWGERVLATGRDPTGRRALVVLDARTGALLSRTLFTAAAPLEVALWDERVAARTAANRVDVFRLQGGRLVAERSFVHPSSVSAARLSAQQLVLREGGELACYDLGRRDELWRARVAGAFRGTPAVRGEDVFALWYDGEGWAHMARLERASGTRRADVRLGQHAPARVPPEDEAAELVAHEHDLFLRLPLGLPSSSGGSLPWARVPLAEDGLGGPVTLHDFLAPPLETANGWCAPERTSAGETRWVLAVREDGRERDVELASPAHHAWLCAARTSASRAGDVLYLGPCAADAKDLEVLWRRPAAPAFRPVPVPRGVLVVEQDLLHRLGPPAEPPDAARDRAGELAAAELRALAEQLAQLALQALRAGDPELALRLVAEAEALGASGRALQLARGETARAVGNARALQLDPRRRGAVLADERAARERVAEELARAARLAPDAALQRALLAELFARAPEHPAGLEVLRALLPSGAVLAPGQAPSWLELLEVGRTLQIELVTGSPDDPRLAPEELRHLAGERERWRADAVAYASPRLFVITAGAAPGAVARAVQAGELVCDVLEGTFGSARPSAARLVLVLYSTRVEYLQHGGGDLGGLESILGWTAGHYDLGAGLARMFLPAQDEGNARLVGVYAHELAHHWLAARAPFGPPRAGLDTRGAWIAEAIATWAEELLLDPAARTWASGNERAASLDTLAAARGEDLIPWPRFLAASCAEQRALETRPTCLVSLAWQLGANAERSPMQLSYAQGGALAHYLFDAEGGRHRDLLLRAVEAYYRGTPLDVAAALGTTPADLGQEVQAFARAVVRADLVPSPAPDRRHRGAR